MQLEIAVCNFFYFPSFLWTSLRLRYYSTLPLRITSAWFRPLSLASFSLSLFPFSFSCFIFHLVFSFTLFFILIIITLSILIHLFLVFCFFILFFLNLFIFCPRRSGSFQNYHELRILTLNWQTFKYFGCFVNNSPY